MKLMLPGLLLALFAGVALTNASAFSGLVDALFGAALNFSPNHALTALCSLTLVKLLLCAALFAAYRQLKNCK
jgi:hypothetical protein